MLSFDGEIKLLNKLLTSYPYTSTSTCDSTLTGTLPLLVGDAVMSCAFLGFFLSLAQGKDAFRFLVICYSSLAQRLSEV